MTYLCQFKVNFGFLQSINGIPELIFFKSFIQNTSSPRFADIPIQSEVICYRVKFIVFHSYRLRSSPATIYSLHAQMYTVTCCGKIGMHRRSQMGFNLFIQILTSVD